jgi:hypothetical protein
VFAGTLLCCWSCMDAIKVLRLAKPGVPGLRPPFSVKPLVSVTVDPLLMPANRDAAKRASASARARASACARAASALLWYAARHVRPSDAVATVFPPPEAACATCSALKPSAKATQPATRQEASLPGCGFSTTAPSYCTATSRMPWDSNMATSASWNDMPCHCGPRRTPCRLCAAPNAYSRSHLGA